MKKCSKCKWNWGVLAKKWARDKCQTIFFQEKRSKSNPARSLASNFGINGIIHFQPRRYRPKPLRRGDPALPLYRALMLTKSPRCQVLLPPTTVGLVLSRRPMWTAPLRALNNRMRSRRVNTIDMSLTPLPLEKWHRSPGERTQPPLPKCVGFKEKQIIGNISVRESNGGNKACALMGTETDV